MKVVIILSTAFLAFFCACKETPEISNQGPLGIRGHLSANSLSQLSAYNLQNANANVVLRYSAGFTNWGGGNTTPGAIANAVFVNDSVPEFVTAVSIDGALVPADSQSYIYTNLGAPVLTPNAIDWSITGYEGTNFSNNASLPSTLAITSPNPRDSVSASSGFTVYYGGSNGGDLISTVQFSDAFNTAWGSTSVADTGKGSFQTTTSDNGSISFSSSDLAGISRGWIDVDLSHWEFHIDTLTNGRTVMVRSTYEENIPLYLKP